MKKEINSYKSTKENTMKDLEFKKLVNDSEKLAKVNDLWYFVKSQSNRWIVGSGQWALIQISGELSLRLVF
nr:YydF family exported signaling peptide [Staphylococcus pseudintermedius]